MKKTELRKLIRQVISEDIGPGAGVAFGDPSSDAYRAKLAEIKRAVSNMLRIAEEFESITQFRDEPEFDIMPNDLGLLVPDYSIKNAIKDQPRIKATRALFDMPRGITLSQFLVMVLKQVESKEQ
jgi:hypothetical protein